MKALAVLFAGGMFVVPTALAQVQEPPVIDGYVTRVASNSDFDVNGYRVLCDSETLSLSYSSSGETLSTSGCPVDVPYLGEPVNIYGSLKKKKLTVRADKIEVRPAPTGVVHGSAVIDALPSGGSESSSPGSLLVRADGRRILIGGESALTLIPPLHALADARPGDWIEYIGRLSADALVHAEKVKISPNIVSKAEAYARSDLVHVVAIPDPSRPDTAAVKYIAVDDHPASFYFDPAIQARVDAIMKKLIPPFQRDLPDGDPRKIKFRFQITADRPWNRVVPLPKGVILIPHQVVERLQNDSELAAVLADGIAFTMENEAFRMRAVVPVVATASFAYFDPLIAWGITETAKTVVEQIRDDQSDRVALCLMHDAGYDIDQAPLAWWLLASKKPKPISRIPLPRRAAYLYRILGETWHNPVANQAAAVTH
jgi:hypothetical protein